MIKPILVAMLLALPLPVWSAGSNQTAPITGPELAGLLGRNTSATVKFVEHQYRQILKQPIELSGELTFEPPDVFIRRVLTPRQEEYRIDDNMLSITLPNKKLRQVSTRNQPLLRGLMLGFQAVVSGQLSTLQPTYSLQLSGSAENWQLLLLPVEAQLSRYVKQISITGHQNQPARFEVSEVNGDRTVTEIVQ